MAMQSGIGLSKIIILVGAGYTGSIVMRNGKLSDILGELQTLLKGLEKSGDPSNNDSDYSDALAAQVRRLASDVRQLATARPITVFNGNSSQMGSITSLVMPAAALGALGYGYMWWKGLSLSDLMYVTKRNMANAVSSMTKNLEQISASLAAAKKHLTQRIENLDGKLDEQKEISKLIKNEVTDVRADLSQIGFDLGSLRNMVHGLDGKIGTLESKQDFANAGVWYLCQFAGSRDGKMFELLKDIPKPTTERHRQLLGSMESTGNNTLKGLKQIADTLCSEIDKSKMDASMQDGINSLDYTPRTVTRTTSIKC
ncbi:uncharacterized protein LOC143881346 [Tasmannia lanceolata]|uniref:uncharacterized protein LOC143881346 n=1 Tax=Tasmannia lanceolata TaxID=3420 RepID=UPI004062DCC6